MRLTRKLAFVHRVLWQRDPIYRAVVLFGPPPLIGCALAASVLAGLHQIAPLTDASRDVVPWAHWSRPVPLSEQVLTAQPTAALPSVDTSGGFVGFLSGWQGTIQPMSVDATMDADISAAVIARFTLDQPTISLARILDAGPPAGLFVGAERGFIVIRTAGVYAFALRLQRSSPQSADCIVRFNTSRQRLVRNINLNTSGDAVLHYPAAEFQLEPGLYLVAVGVGCWRGDHMVGPGELTLLIRHPGDDVLRPARADEVIRAVSRQ